MGDGLQCTVDVLWGRLDLLVVKQVDHVLQYCTPDSYARVNVNLLTELWCEIDDVLDARQHVVLPLVEVVEDLHAGLGPKSREHVPQQVVGPCRVGVLLGGLYEVVLQRSPQ